MCCTARVCRSGAVRGARGLRARRLAPSARARVGRPSIRSRSLISVSSPSSSATLRVAASVMGNSSFNARGVTRRVTSRTRRCLLRFSERASLDEEDFMAERDPALCGACRLLDQKALLEVGGQLVEFVRQHPFGVTPAFLRPEPVHADAFDQDRQQQAAQEAPQRSDRQRCSRAGARADHTDQHRRGVLSGGRTAPGRGRGPVAR